MSRIKANSDIHLYSVECGVLKWQIADRLGITDSSFSRRLRRELPLSGLHTCPSSSLDVPDEQSVRLVVMQPEDTFKMGNEQSKALLSATDILNNRGTSPRIYRNMLAFLAPDTDVLNALKQEVRRFLAWKSIKADSEDLNLDAAQNR